MLIFIIPTEICILAPPPWPKPLPLAQPPKVWDACDWLLNGSLVAAAAPPSEKPPPPPPPEDDDDDACAEQEAADGRAQQTSAHQYHHNQVENCSAGRAPAPADTRFELRKRRSDFLGFDSGRNLTRLHPHCKQYSNFVFLFYFWNNKMELRKRRLRFRRLRRM